MKSGTMFDSKQMQAAGTLLEFAQPISITKDQIAKVHMIATNVEMGAIGSSIRVYFSLKSAKVDGQPAPESENDLIQDKHTFWRLGFAESRLTSGVFFHTDNHEVYFDPPLVLIRPPRVCFLSGIATASYLNVFWYYTKEKVGKDDLARLMVRNHA